MSALDAENRHDEERPIGGDVLAYGAAMAAARTKTLPGAQRVDVVREGVDRLPDGLVGESSELPVGILVGERVVIDESTQGELEVAVDEFDSIAGRGHEGSSRVGASAAATADATGPTLEVAPGTSSLSGGVSGAPSGDRHAEIEADLIRRLREATVTARINTARGMSLHVERAESEGVVDDLTPGPVPPKQAVDLRDLRLESHRKALQGTPYAFELDVDGAGRTLGIRHLGQRGESVADVGADREEFVAEGRRNVGGVGHEPTLEADLPVRHRARPGALLVALRVLLIEASVLVALAAVFVLLRWAGVL